MKHHDNSIGGSAVKLEAVRRRLEETQLNAVRELLTDKVITTICSECGYYFRERLFTPLVTIFHMIGAAISREQQTFGDVVTYVAKLLTELWEAGKGGSGLAL